jgi:hypothetical protein
MWSPRRARSLKARVKELQIQQGGIAALGSDVHADGALWGPIVELPDQQRSVYVNQDRIEAISAQDRPRSAVRQLGSLCELWPPYLVDLAIRE